MSNYDDYFLKNYSFFTYVYMISKIEKYNKYITEKFDNIEQSLYDGNGKFNTELINEIINT
jgi:hypothetical protein